MNTNIPHIAVWHYILNDRQFGPVVAPEIQRLIRAGRLPANALLWKAGMSGWLPLNDVPEFAPKRKVEAEPEAKADLNAEIWYYSVDDKNFGPLSGKKVRMYIRSGVIKPETKVWNKQMDIWRPAAEVPEFEGVKARMIQVTRPPMAPHQERAQRAQRAKAHKRDVTASDRLRDTFGVEGCAALLVFAYIGLIWSLGIPARFEQTMYMIVALAGICGLATLWRSFTLHWGWTLAVLFIPFGALIYLLVDIKKTWRILLLMAVTYIGGFFYLTQTDFSQSPNPERLNELQQTLRNII